MEYILAGLDRDGLAKLANKVRSGELSAHAAAIAAGYHNEETALDLLSRAWAEASVDERITVLNEVAESTGAALAPGTRQQPERRCEMR